jgi:hypothetical protein
MTEGQDRVMETTGYGHIKGMNIWWYHQGLYVAEEVLPSYCASLHQEPSCTSKERHA